MPDLDYHKLSRIQKLAVLLIVIGPEAAAEVLKHFDDAEAEQLCREMTQLPLVPQAAQRLALEEFSTVVAQSAGSALGGIGYVQRTLGLAKGGYKASAILDRVGPATPAVDAIKDVGEMEGRQIFNLIKDEQPQTIAFVLSHLDSSKASEVFMLLGSDLRDEVAERLGTLESTALDHVDRIARSLGRRLDLKARPALHRSGGVRSVADLLRGIDKDASKSLLARLEERNATLGSAIRKKLFSFEDVGRLSASDLQRVLREIDSANLALSMKAASEPLREKIYAAISKRAAEGLREEIELLGSVRVKDVEAAQDTIIQIVRRLEEEGQISLDGEGAQSLVA